MSSPAKAKSYGETVALVVNRTMRAAPTVCRNASKPLVPDDFDMVDIVHCRAADAAIVPGESHRFDQVDGRSEAGAEAHDCADVSGNFRLVEGDPHAPRLSEEGG